MFDNKFITQGVDLNIPKIVVTFMFELIDQMEVEKDYLQIFELTKKRKNDIFMDLIVKHSQEKPAYSKEYQMPYYGPSIEYTGKVYVIDDGDHCTMLLAEEY